MKGIILAAGEGTRLRPSTNVICKPLLPIYDKPMIYYPLSTLIDAGINDILIITNSQDQHRFFRLLGDGSQFGIKLSYLIQYEQKGIADAFIIAEKFIGDDDVCLILCDNLFYGTGIKNLLRQARYKVELEREAVIFGYQVEDGRRFGVVEFDQYKNVVSIEEKPEVPKSNFAIVGIYFFTAEAVDLAKNVTPSARGEMEITSVMEGYLNQKKLSVELMDKSFTWMDTGTHAAMFEATQFIMKTQQLTGKLIGSPDEAAFNNKFISNLQLKENAELLLKTEYGEYINSVADKKTAAC